jgi:hypothetical protein
VSGTISDLDFFMGNDLRERGRPRAGAALSQKETRANPRTTRGGRTHNHPVPCRDERPGWNAMKMARWRPRGFGGHTAGQRRRILEQPSRSTARLERRPAPMVAGSLPLGRPDGRPWPLARKRLENALLRCH